MDLKNYTTVTKNSKYQGVVRNSQMVMEESWTRTDAHVSTIFEEGWLYQCYV